MVYSPCLMWMQNERFVIAVFIAVVFVSATGHGQVGTLENEVEARLQFEVALQALEGDEPHLALGVLEALAASAAGEAPDRRVCEALMASAEGRGADSDAAVLEILSETSPEDFTYTWIYDELVRRGAAIRLAELKSRATADLEALLAKHYEALGGLDRLLALDDVVATGRMSVDGLEIPFRLYRKRSRFYRLDLATARGSRITACDGHAAWQYDPMNESGKVEYLTGELGENLLNQSWFDGVLIRHHSTGERLFLSGIEDLDGADAHRIEVDLPDGGRHSIFLDAESLLEVRRLLWGENPADPTADIIYEYGDIDGLPMPVRQTVTTATGTVEYLFDGYELQQPIDVRVFDAASVISAED
jgi:hypothetical protein